MNAVRFNVRQSIMAVMPRRTTTLERVRCKRVVNALRFNVRQSILAVMPRCTTTRERVRCSGVIVEQHDREGTSMLERNCSLKIKIRASVKLVLYD